MALVKGICKNFGECDMADNKEVQEVEKSNFVCEECGKPLHPVDGGSKTTGTGNGGGGANKKLLGIIAAAVGLLAGAGFGIYKLIGGGPEIDKIKLDPKSIALEVGQRDVIKATVVDKDGKEITDAKVVYKWTVKDEEVASVTQGGEVAALKKGKTSITVKIEGDDTHRATCQVEVKGGGTLPPPPPPGDTLIKTIAITDAKNFTLKKGDNKQLQYQATPESNSETPVWVSSDPSVATVDATGLVTAVKKGTAQISVKAKKVASAPVTVTVTEEPKPDGGGGGVRTGTLRLSYGTYTGQIKNGYPNGQGRLVYKTSRQISRFDSKGRTAEAGESVQGSFVNGFLTVGKHFDTSGNLIESLNIGTPVNGVYESK